MKFIPDEGLSTVNILLILLRTTRSTTYWTIPRIDGKICINSYNLIVRGRDFDFEKNKLSVKGVGRRLFYEIQTISMRNNGYTDGPLSLVTSYSYIEKLKYIN